MSNTCKFFDGLCQDCPYPKCYYEEPDEETCDYTGDLCIGSKGFCEECEIMIGD